MTLTVPFEEFAPTVQRVLGQKEAYVTAHGRGTLATASKNGDVVVASSKSAPAVVSEQLTEAGLTVHEGSWHTEHQAHGHESEECYVAAVAYSSSDDKPGLWMDAYPDPPTGVQVLRAMYDELLSTGELQETSFEEFLRLANANVIILAPADIRSFANAKDC